MSKKKRPNKGDVTQEDLEVICNHSLLSAEEEFELGTKALAGDEQAVQALVSKNLRLVASIAKGFTTNKFTFGDALSTGTIGLIKAARKFDPSKGHRFSTYATSLIRYAIMIAFQESKGAVVRVPHSYTSLLYRKGREGEKLTPSENSTLVKAQSAQRNYREIGTLPLNDEPQAEEETEPRYSPEIKAFVKKCFTKLDKEDQDLLCARFGLGKYKRPLTLKQISTVEGITTEAVRLRESRALQRLREVVRLEHSNHH